MPQREWLDLGSESAMLSLRLPVIRYRGAGGGRPGAYLQAALHAEEQPGVAAIHELAKLLTRAEAEGRILRDITLVPYANPIGLHQAVDGRVMGRFHLGSGVNFNRAFPLPPVNQGASLNSGKQAEPPPAPRADQALKAALVNLAAGHDVILDLHCDKEASVYAYCHAELWPGARDLAARLGAAAVLLWSGPEEGGAAFEEAITIDRLPATSARPFLSATVELRGQSDVDPALAHADALALYAVLADRGVLSDPGVPPAPAWNGPAVRQDRVLNVSAPALGTLLFECPLGARVSEGQLLARILASPGEESGEVEVRAPASGLLLIRARDRLARPGETIATLITDRPAKGAAVGRTLSNR
ncbi:MAG TPA: succinylglutamate desuccinylase/aspartoacylase family protein [Dongiaceae bacterium]|nr:succinylglutamate desuccinylase/aspartoacylase family protein [Dongiaceae bacterium]